MSDRSTRAMVAFGGNLASAAGGPADTIRLALNEIRSAGLRITRQSDLYDTPAFPDARDPAYVNGVAEIAGISDPLALLALLHGIEAMFGRERVERWGMRTLDLDLLAFGDLVRPDAAGFERWRGLAPEARRLRAPDELILPHPRLHERAFVLVPLAEIAPERVISGIPVRDGLASVSTQGIERLPDTG